MIRIIRSALLVGLMTVLAQASEMVVVLPVQGPVTPGSPLVWTHPAGEKGWYQKGLRREHDGSADWRGFYGLQLDIDLATGEPVELTATLRVPPEQARSSLVPRTSATVRVVGAGRQRVNLPWAAFDFRQAQPAFLRFVQQVEIACDRRVEVVGARVVRGLSVSVDADVRGRSVGAGQAAEYRVTVSNCTAAEQAVSLSFEQYGWEAMRATVEPSALQLAGGASAEVKVRVEVPDRIPPGGRERQILRAVANGDAASAARLELVTAAAMSHPYVLHTPPRWQEVRDKVARHEWARRLQEEYLRRAERWIVPEVARPPRNVTGVDDAGPFLFNTTVEQDLMACAISYQLTGDAKHAQKVRQFLLNLSSPHDGYPVTYRACNQSLVQEGHFFQHIAMAYDMALPAGVFSDAERARIETTLRLFIETIEFETSAGAINNWNLSEICGALYCGLVLQDMSVVDRFFAGPGGVKDQLAHGMLDDGWWYECSISYNVWCTTEFTQVALALEPWGINFRDLHVPVGYSKNYSLRPFDNVDGLYGMSFQKWGPVTRSYANIKRMWDALPVFVDYRGVMFGVNDATERAVGGAAYDIAYYVYRDPAYAAMVKQGGTRDLLYGIGELPEATPELWRQSAYADNVGVAMLRSPGEGKPDRERIQAVLHYGTHGGFHGHFDRTNLLHLSRYGRSFYNPEMVWYSYAPFMYKFYVQNSTSKNMVVVDRKMQEPVESRRLLWHTGKLFGAAAVETNARWSTPPYGGMVYPEQGYKSLQEKAWGEGRYLTKPDNEPEYGSVTEFTEPILQRRLMVVTDDYVLLADYVKGQREHTFESLLQMKGFKGIDAADVKPLRHDAQWDANPILDAQFVTDCDWYTATAPAKASFQHRWGEGADNEGTRAPESAEGILNLDVHTLWPAKQELMVGTAPEDHGVQKRLFWTVRGDGRTLAEGKFGAWILGKDEIDVPVGGVSTLELETRVEKSQKPTIFWANPRLVLSDGREVPLSELSPAFDFENTLHRPSTASDYFGGPVKIAGTAFNFAIAGQPKDESRPAKARVTLDRVQAVRFKATIGGDYPPGDESQRRRTFASKVVGSEARFLTIIAPYETASVVRSARAIDPDQVEVKLNDGRTQIIKLVAFTGAGDAIEVTIAESRDGQTLRTESSRTTP